MSRIVQMFNPVHGQRIDKTRLNVMGRVLDKNIKNVNIHLDRALIRRVRVSNTGAFECRMDLGKLGPGKHEVETRIFAGHRTERMVVPFYIPDKSPEPEKEPQAEADVSESESR